MNQYGNLFKSLKRITLAILLGMVMVGCASGPSVEVVNTPIEKATEQDKPKEIAVVENPICGGEETRPAMDPDQYGVVLEASEKIKLGSSGTLRVWIGLEKFMPKPNQNMVRDTTSWYSSNISSYARITPNAKHFKIEPEGSKCVKIDPTGSGVQFVITPEEKGEFEVSATIELFDNEECKGIPVSKPAQVVSVKVKVAYFDELWSVVWEYFTRFWVAFVALVFAALLFVVRRFIKNKTGYSSEENEKKEQERLPG